jgi:hypothetical protein
MLSDGMEAGLGDAGAMGVEGTDVTKAVDCIVPPAIPLGVVAAFDDVACGTLLELADDHGDAVELLEKSPPRPCR